MLLADAGHAGAHLHGGHGANDIALMVLIACGVCFAILDAGCRVRAAHGRARLAWRVVGSLVIGLGIWAMHFVAGLCRAGPVALTGEPVVLGPSRVTGLAAAAGALAHGNRGVAGVPPLVVGAGLKGFALIATHYT